MEGDEGAYVVTRWKTKRRTKLGLQSPDPRGNWTMVNGAQPAITKLRMKQELRSLSPDPGGRRMEANAWLPGPLSLNQGRRRWRCLCCQTRWEMREVEIDPLSLNWWMGKMEDGDCRHSTNQWKRKMGDGIFCYFLDNPQKKMDLCFKGFSNGELLCSPMTLLQRLYSPTAKSFSPYSLHQFCFPCKKKKNVESIEEGKQLSKVSNGVADFIRGKKKLSEQ